MRYEMFMKEGGSVFVKGSTYEEAWEKFEKYLFYMRNVKEIEKAMEPYYQMRQINLKAALEAIK